MWGFRAPARDHLDSAEPMHRVLLHSGLQLSAPALPGEFNNPEKLELAQFNQLSSVGVWQGAFILLFIDLPETNFDEIFFCSFLKPGDFVPHTSVL